MKRLLPVTWVVLLVLFHPLPVPSTTGPLVELARPGPWAGVSGLIAYGARLYMVNSQIFVNHNSADIYSYHPGTGAVRFEHRLFSQDAGTPARIDGLLYWPYEDPRFSTTYGEFEITNGHSWQWRVAPEVRGFHMHAMLSHQGARYALASGWRGRVYRSSDHGRHWKQVYEHPSPAGQVSRITAMAALGQDLYFALTAWSEAGVKLLRREQGTIRPVPGWPRGRFVGAMGAFKGMMYAVNHTDHTSRLWRSAGRQVAEPIAALDAYTVHALAATSDTLWAVSDGPDGGRVWRSADGLAWHLVQRLPSVPVAVTVVDDQVFVGTYNSKRGGALWGPARPRPWTVSTALPPLPVQPVQRLSPVALTRALHDLDRALADSANPAYRQRLLAYLLPLALSRDPHAGEALSARLLRPWPQTLVPLFGAQVHVPAAQVAR